ncbi:MAG: PEP-CTERM sorting domain-containing protein [Verrucomicrobiota bacterium]
MKLILATVGVLIFGNTLCQSQGFLNLNFEDAKFVFDPVSGYYPTAVYANKAIPGWTAYAGRSPLSEILLNNVFISGGMVSIIGANSGFGPASIEGSYYILLAGNNYAGSLNTAGIGQTGTIPLNAASLTFWGNFPSDGVSFNGQNLTTFQTGSTSLYNIYAANISAYAGQTGQLLFTTHPGGINYLDNIQFTNSPVPEPGSVALLVAGGLLGAWRWKRS